MPTAGTLSQSQRRTSTDCEEETAKDSRITQVFTNRHIIQQATYVGFSFRLVLPPQPLDLGYH